MPNELCAEVREDELTEIAVSVFDTMLHLETDLRGGPWEPCRDRVTAMVHLVGGWNGTVILECDAAQARRLTGRFLAMDPPESVDDLVRDVMGELANMVAGNLKCVLGPSIDLSMPSVVDGNDYSSRECGSLIRLRLSLLSAEGPFWISVLGRRE